MFLLRYAYSLLDDAIATIFQRYNIVIAFAAITRAAPRALLLMLFAAIQQQRKCGH